MKHFVILHHDTANNAHYGGMIATINDVTIDGWGVNRFNERLTIALSHAFGVGKELVSIPDISEVIYSCEPDEVCEIHINGIGLFIRIVETWIY